VVYIISVKIKVTGAKVVENPYSLLGRPVPVNLFLFTALHAMQTRSSDEILSVRLSNA